VFGAGLLSLVLVGQNAIRKADETAFARQERFAARNPEATIAVIPQQQRSATVWDDAIQNVVARDKEWMDQKEPRRLDAGLLRPQRNLYSRSVGRALLCFGPG